MASYAAFGFQLECDFDLPELTRTRGGDGRAWRIETRRTTAPPGDYEQLGSDVVYADVRVHALASPTTFRVVFDDTGTFDVITAEERIIWYPGTRASDVAVRADLLGRVIAMAAHSSGAMTLHASAVSIDGQAIALLGPKQAGKSTLALALVNAGARLLTDDTLVVRMDARGTAWASPGVQRVRLWDDSARALAVRSHGESGTKPTIDTLPAERLEPSDVRLAACYVLHASSDAAPVRRAAMPAVDAAMSCVRFSKLGSLAGGREGGVVLGRAAALAASVPVFAVNVRRDLGTLDGVAAAFLAWHGRARPANAVATQ